MKSRLHLPQFAEDWRRNVCESPSPRMHDDAREEAFWREFIQQKTYAPEASARQVFAYLLPLLETCHIETVLEFGPGWGSYTIPLAKYCRHLCCVDLSSDVLSFIHSVAQSHHLTNISTVHAKWEEFQPDNPYDLVFGYNCFYRQVDLTECFLRMDRAATKLCVAGMNGGIAPPWIHELDAAGGAVQWEWKDYMHLAGVLYDMGIDANIRILPFTQEISYPNIDALIAGESRRCTSPHLSRGRAEDILCRHFSQGEDGSWKATVPLRSAILWWTPEHDLLPQSLPSL